jgi:hypothetical protein
MYIVLNIILHIRYHMVKKVRIVAQSVYSQYINPTSIKTVLFYDKIKFNI